MLMHLLEDGVLYPLEEANICHRASSPLYVGENSRARVLAEGLNGIDVSTISFYHITVVQVDAAGEEPDDSDEEEDSATRRKNTTRCIWCLEMQIGALFVVDPGTSCVEWGMKVENYYTFRTGRFHRIGSGILFPLSKSATRILHTEARNRFNSPFALEPYAHPGELGRLGSVACHPSYVSVKELGIAPLQEFPVGDGDETRMNLLCLRHLKSAKEPLPRAVRELTPLERCRRLLNKTSQVAFKGAPLASRATACATTLHSLPEDILLDIVSKLLLSDPKAAGRLSRTNRAFASRVSLVAVQTLDRGNDVLDRLSQTPIVPEMLRLSRELDELGVDPLRLVLCRQQYRWRERARKSRAVRIYHSVRTGASAALYYNVSPEDPYEPRGWSV
jgi:hypothetical protein